MSSGIEVVESDIWLDNILKTDTEIETVFDNASLPVNVYDRLAPVDAPYPHILWHLESAVDSGGINKRIMVNTIYVVRVVAEVDSYTPLKPFAKAIDDVLEGAEGTTDDGLVLGVRREAPYHNVEESEGRQIRSLGGRYKIVVTAS